MKPPKKTIIKKFHGRCLVCGEDNPSLLDAHRPVQGKDNGKYLWGNVFTACANCHRRIHSGEIVVHRRHLSSAGWVWHCLIEGKEVWIPDKPFWRD